MQTADFYQLAGVDPYPRAQAVLDARPGEVTALGEAFLAAATELQTSADLTGIAAQLADASAVFDGATPTELMHELEAVRQTLSVGPTELSAIGAALVELAGSLAISQQQVIAVLAELEEQTAAVLMEYQQQILLAETMDWAQHYRGLGAALVVAAHATVNDLIDAYDARAGELLGTLQQLGYLLPPDVDSGLPEPIDGYQCLPGGDGLLAPSWGSFIPTGTPQQLAAWWAGLSPGAQALLIQQQPDRLAALSGLPAHVYDMVNRRALADDDATGAHEEAALAEYLWELPEFADVGDDWGLESVEQLMTMPTNMLHVLAWSAPMSVKLLIELMLTKRGRQRAIDDVQKSVTTDAAGQNRYLLEYDLQAHDSDGSAVIGVGDVDEADNVAVVVQGATHSIDTIAEQTAAGEAILAEMEKLSDADNAVIIYAGYDNPTLPEAMLPHKALEGGQLLLEDLAGYDAAQRQATGGSAHTTVIAHSYGTTTTSQALQNGAEQYVDAVVLYGSPGVLATSTQQLGMDADSVYVGMADDDVLTWIDLIDPGIGWVHLGPDPSRPSFGATIVSVEGTDGHGGYFSYQDGKPNDALHNAAAVAAGTPTQVIEE